MKFNELSQELQELWTRGVDHGVFNEDWAKMGGVGICADDDTVQPTDIFFKLPIFKQDLLKKIVIYMDNSTPFIMDAGHFKLKRMATPSECAEAGIDYVPFMGWRDIESVPKNVSVLTRTKGGVGIGSYEQNLRQTHWMPLPLV